MGKPISEKHAIEAVSFIVTFEHPFTPKIVESLPGLHERLKDDYPIFNPTNVMEVNLTGTEATQKIGVASGGLLQHLRADGRPDWTMRVEGSVIVVTCADYQRWGDISSKALNHIAAAITFVNEDTNAVSSLVFQVVDRFVTADKNSYEIGQVFNTQSDFLTKQTLQAGLFWHVFQGWFDDKTEFDAKLLNVLNLSTSEIPAGSAMLTTIDHAAHLRFSSLKAISVIDADFIRKAFNELHTGNKSVIKKLLTESQSEAIGLTK